MEAKWKNKHCKDTALLEELRSRAKSVLKHLKATPNFEDSIINEVDLMVTDNI